tara:strand:+ start:57 stop:800 length:744 start_codon:yes stop_codon:yes gene_type:complete
MIELYNEDCFKVLSSLQDNSIDCLFTSPPYNARLRILNGKYVKRKKSDSTNRKYLNFTDDLTMEDYEKFLDNLFSESLRVSKISFINLQILTGNKIAIFKMIGKYSQHIKEMIIWDKINSQPAISEKVMNSTFEFFLILSREKSDAMKRKFKVFNSKRGAFQNIIRVKSKQSFTTCHSASMPLEVARILLKNFTKKHDLVCDPFMGTGTTGVICKSLNRQFIGVEINQDYFQIAKERIEFKTQAIIL